MRPARRELALRVGKKSSLLDYLKIMKGDRGMNYLISEAAKKVEVESHVLRYWEDELGLPIKRNELGHRYYTSEDIERFIQIKNWKNQGLQLKAIRLLLKDGKLIPLDGKMEAGNIPAELLGISRVSAEKAEVIEAPKTIEAPEVTGESREQKLQRMAQLFKQTLVQAITEVNAAQTAELQQKQTQEINDAKEHILKELNYQMQTVTEKEEEHYRKLDELLRRKSNRLHDKKRQETK